jgi:hypothetical protein
MGPARMLGYCPLALSLALLCGCQRNPPALNSVSGKVLFRGGYVPGGLIVFTPDASRGAGGAIAFGKIKEDGSYNLFTGEAEGVPAGWYRVSVAALVPASGLPDRVPPPVSILPDKYRDPGASLLLCEVKPDRPNHLDFNLD